MSRWLRLTKAGGLAVGAAAAGVGAVIAAEKIAVGRLRLRPDPAADEPLGQLRGRPLTVLADDGVPLHAEVAGPDDAPVTIVFTHGYTLTQDCWHYQRQGLEETARLVFWDQRGHGRSPRLWPDGAAGAAGGADGAGGAAADGAAGVADAAGAGAAGVLLVRPVLMVTAPLVAGLLVTRKLVLRELELRDLVPGGLVPGAVAGTSPSSRPARTWPPYWPPPAPATARSSWSGTPWAA